MPDPPPKNKRRREAQVRATGRALRGLLAAVLARGSGGALSGGAAPGASTAGDGRTTENPPPPPGSEKAVDGAQSATIESTSARQKTVGPRFAPGADLRNKPVWSRPRNDSASLRSEISAVKGDATDVPPEIPVTERESGLPNDAFAAAAPTLGGTVTPLRVPFTYNLRGVAREIQRNGAQLRYDEALDECLIMELPPWLDPGAMAEDDRDETRVQTTLARTYPRRLERVDAIACAEWLERNQDQAVAIGLCFEALTVIAHNHRFNGVKRAFADLPEWDLVDRFASLSSLLGLQAVTIQDHEANGRTVGRWLSKTMRRILSPGAPHEDPLFLEEVVDVNGTMRALAQLLPHPSLFMRGGADFDPRHQSAVQRMCGKAIVAIGDVALASNGRMELLASFAVRDHDGKGVPARQCGFVALSSMHHTDYIAHEFVAVRAGEPPQLTLDPTIRNQLWAQARAGIDELPIVRPSRTVQRDPEDGWDPPVRRYLHREVRAGAVAFSVSVILREAIKIPLDRQVPAHAARIGRILRACKFRRRRTRDLTTGERPAVWYPPSGFVKTAEELAAFAEEEAAAAAAAEARAAAGVPAPPASPASAADRGPDSAAAETAAGGPPADPASVPPPVDSVSPEPVSST